MKNLLRHLSGLLTQPVIWFFILFSAASSACAIGYAEHPKAKELAQKLEIENNIPQEKTLRLLASAQRNNKVIQLYSPKETQKRSSDWDTYRKQFVEPFRIQEGLQFWQDNQMMLQEAELRYGVPASVIVAIIGVETLYGRNMGTDKVLDALATLSFDFPSGTRDRSPFFYNELGAFIVLTEQLSMDATTVKGSYAGAMGLGQFMPTSWQTYAVDGDGDGKIDLLTNLKDGIFSVANFLKEHGWKTGHAMLVPIEFNHKDHLDTLLAPDIVPTFTAKEMTQKGVELKRKTLEEEKLALIKLVQGDKPATYVVGGQNFFVVTRYNRSSFYATAVLELAEAIEAKMKK